MVSILTTQSTFLKTSLTSNTIFLLAKDKEMNMSSSAARLKTKHGRACEETCSPGLSWVRELYRHLPGQGHGGPAGVWTLWPGPG